MLVTLSREQEHFASTGGGLEHPHAVLVEQPVEQALARKRRIDQLDILDGRRSASGLRPRRRPRERRGAPMPAGASPGSRSGCASVRPSWAGIAAACRRRASGDAGRRRPRAAPLRPRAAPWSESVPSAGSIHARHPRDCRRSARPGPGSGSSPGRWSIVMARWPRPSSSPADLGAAPATTAGSNWAQARTVPEFGNPPPACAPGRRSWSGG